MSLGCFCGGSAAAYAENGTADPAAAAALQGKIDFMQKRMARLVQALDPATRSKVLETMGRECAKEFSHLIDKFRGKPNEFLAEVQRQWVESATYDAQKGTLRIVDKATACTCAFVKAGVTPGEFCECTLGWQKEVYSGIFGEPVDAELESSILRGGQRCIFSIRCKR